MKVVHDTVNVVHTKLRYLLKCNSVVSKTKCTPIICRNMQLLTISKKSRYALLCEQLWLDSHILCVLYSCLMYNFVSAFYLGMHFVCILFFSKSSFPYKHFLRIILRIYFLGVSILPNSKVKVTTYCSLQFLIQ